MPSENLKPPFRDLKVVKPEEIVDPKINTATTGTATKVVLPQVIST